MTHRPLRYASVPLSLRLIPTLRSARSSWLEARVGNCRLRPAAASHAASVHEPTHVRTHSTLGLTVIANDQTVVAFSLLHAQPPALLPPPSDLAACPATFLFFFRVPTLFLAGRSFFLFASRCVGCSFFLLAFALCRVPRLPATKNPLARAHTNDRRTDDATCGPQAWLTGRLHGGGTRSVRSPPRRAPLLATPIAKPLQCGRP